MIRLRRASDRGRTSWGWLDSRHTFSFGEYFDPAHSGFRALRVINDDRVSPGAGFGAHSHRDMEILSYVLEGALAHKDSMGNGSVIRPGEIQMMRAGTGITHSEHNASPLAPVHFLQIWILPDEGGLPPTYDQRTIDQHAAERRFALLASSNGRDDSIRLHQDVDLWLAQMSKQQTRELPLQTGRNAWVHLARGAAELNDTPLEEGDGAAVSGEEKLVFKTGDAPAEVLVFDLL